MIKFIKEDKALRILVVVVALFLLLVVIPTSLFGSSWFEGVILVFIVFGALGWLYMVIRFIVDC